MSSLPEGGDMREGGSVSGPFAAAAFPRVIHCRRLLCSTHRTANGPSGESYAVDARFFDQCGNCNYPDMLGKCRVYCVDGKVESMNRLSKLKERVSVSIPSCSRDVSRKWFHGGKMLRSVTFGASSRLERIHDYAFYRTGIESLSIPDSVCKLGDHCFASCKSLRSVTFGASSRLERICTLYLCIL